MFAAHRLPIVFAVLAGLALPVAAQASVIIDLVQTGFTALTNGFGDGRPLTFSAQLVVDEEDFAGGANPSVFNRPSGGPFRADLDGLLNLDAGIRNPDGRALLLTPLREFLTPLPPNASVGLVKNFAFALSPAAVSGFILFNNQETDFRVTLSGDGTFSGTVNTDRGGTCGVTGNCSFAGVVVVSVPEPSGLVAIALGGFTLAALYRRRRVA